MLRSATLATRMGIKPRIIAVPVLLMMISVALPVLFPSVASAAGPVSSVTVTPSVIGEGETAIIRLHLAGGDNPHHRSPEILLTQGKLGPVTWLGGGDYVAELTYDGPGSTLITVRPDPWRQIEATAVAHFRGPSAEGIPHIAASPAHRMVESVDGAWMSAIGEGISISGMPPSAVIDRVRVAISSGYHPFQDELGLLIDGAFLKSYVEDGISVSYDDGVLTLSGEAPVDRYLDLLQRVTYRNTALHPLITQRTIDFVLGEVDESVLAHDPVTGHYYEYVHDPSTWVSANHKASARSLYGLQGYLATIGSAYENDIVGSIALEDAWIGASSYSNLYGGYWWWVTGPEAGTIFSEWKHPFNGAYTNWADWNQNNSQQRFYVYMNGQTRPPADRFQWVNPPHGPTAIVPGYIVEYGGFPGDAGVLKLKESVFVDFPPVPPGPPLDPAKSWLTVSPGMVTANGIDWALVTVTLKDEDGNPFLSAPPAIIVRNAHVGPIDHWGDGVYTARVTSTTPGTSQVVVQVEGVEVLRSGLITFRKGDIDDDEPFLTMSQPEVAFNPNDDWTVIDAGVDILGMKAGSPLSEAKVAIVEGLKASEDELGFVVNGEWRSAYGVDGISATYDPAAGTLTLLGEAGWEAYRQALRSVAYRNKAAGSGDVSMRRIEFSIVKEMPGRIIGYDSTSDHYYEYVDAPRITWHEAEAAAANRSLHGRQGYLATITSQEENDFIAGFTPKSAWIGAGDFEQHETWRWVTGPETGQVFWHGLSDGVGVSGTYANWASGEPNHYSTNWGLEHWVQIFGQDAQKLDGVLPTDIGKWNDLSYYHDTWVDGYIVEYGGMIGDPVQVRFTDSIILNILGNLPPVADFTWAPELPRFGEPVSFIDLSIDPEGAPLTYHWTFGDGHASADPNPTHTYTDVGEYTVTLTVKDAAQLWHKTSKTIHVTADVRGYVFNDRNRNGLRDGDEEGLGMPDLYIAVVRDGAVVARAPDAIGGHIFNHQTGEYVIRRLAAGSYDVVLTRQGSQAPVIPDGWRFTTGVGATPSERITVGALATVAPGTKGGPDFGFAYGMLVRGAVFRDDGSGSGIPNDGERNGAEAGVSGLRLRALGAQGEPLGSTLTDGQGAYELVLPIGGTMDQHPPVIRLILSGTIFRATGYTPGAGNAPTRLPDFRDAVDVPLEWQPDVDTYAGYDFGVVPAMTIDGSAAGAAVRGGFVAYPLTARLGTAGLLSWVVTTPRGWEYTVYRDLDGDGSLSPGDMPVPASGFAMGPGDVPLLLVVRPPTWEADGAVDTARIDIGFTYAGNPALTETAHIFSHTTVRAGRLELTVELRNVTQTLPAGGGFTQTRVDAREGDILEYRVTYRNAGTSKVTDISVAAPIPLGTRLVADAYGSGLPIGWQHGEGDAEISAWSISIFLDQLLPDQYGSFTYQVILE